MRLLLLFICLLLSSSSIFAQNISTQLLGRYTDGREGTCEITAYDSSSRKLFITNAVTDSIDIIDCSNPSQLTRVGRIDISAYGGGINSVAYLPTGHIAAAVENSNPQAAGFVVFFDVNGNYVNKLTVGALPDMLTATPDGTKLLVACEGEPNSNYTVDPQGTIAIIDLTVAVASLSAANVTLLDFQQAPATIAGGVFKPNTSYALDLEPEYIAVNAASTEAAVVCQENNVFVLVDLTADTIKAYKGLGFKNHNLTGNGLDASDRDGTISIALHPVKGVYQPDAIASYTVGGATYYLSANEGDARDYNGYSSETRIKNLTLDSAAFPQAATLQADAVLGRLKTFTADVIGDTDGDGDVDELYSYGARSFSIWDSNGQLVWDSGDAIAQYIARNHPSFFNCNDGKASKKDKRSDDKGAEPEALTVGKIGNKYFAFIGLERQGGIMIYDITNPTAPVFEQYIHTFNSATGESVDVAPEGLVFVPASASHTQQNLLIVSNEVSGTTVIYKIEQIIVGATASTSQKSIQLYPNPTTGIVNLELPHVENTLNYQLYNALGQLLLQGQWQEEQEQLSLEHLPNGCYFLMLEGEQLSRTSYQIIKQ